MNHMTNDTTPRWDSTEHVRPPDFDILDYSDLFDDLPLAAQAFDTCQMTASWGDNDLTLIHPRRIRRALDDVLPNYDEGDGRATEQIEEAIRRLDVIEQYAAEGAYVYIDMES